MPFTRELETELYVAADTIERLLATLDVSVSTCGCCERQSWDDPDEYQLARSMAADVDRLRKRAAEAKGIRMKRAADTPTEGGTDG